MGHIKIAQAVRDSFHLQKILFIPSYIPPHKESADIASPFHRLKMVELALSSYPRFIPTSIEIEAKGKSYSILTLKKLKKLYPRALIFFILGIDAFLEIDTWKESRRVLQQCFFIIVSRPGYRLEEAKDILEEDYREQMVEIAESERVEDDMLRVFRLFLFSMESLDIASTDIRRKVKKGDSLRGMVPPAVEKYILENQLYHHEKG
jgi:nicotinate-nucleotide adenylyltransferase